MTDVSIFHRLQKALKPFKDEILCHRPDILDESWNGTAHFEPLTLTVDECRELLRVEFILRKKVEKRGLKFSVGDWISNGEKTFRIREIYAKRVENEDFYVLTFDNGNTSLSAPAEYFNENFKHGKARDVI